MKRFLAVLIIFPNNTRVSALAPHSKRFAGFFGDPGERAGHPEPLSKPSFEPAYNAGTMDEMK